MRLACVIASLVTLISTASFSEQPQLEVKHLVGYQGWFGCPNDGAGNQWSHWFRNRQALTQPNLVVDLWPDLSEFSPAGLCPTALRLPSGEAVKVFSSANHEVVSRHFKWMKQYNIDGVVLQRFGVELVSENSRRRPDAVLQNVRSAASAYDKSFYIMYDLSGLNTEVAIETITRDWDSLKSTNLILDQNYITYRGKPVVGIWGLGFTHIPLNPEQAAELVDFFKRQGIAIVGGVPAYWRTLTNDARTDPEWTNIYRSLDVLSPWTVGRYTSIVTADKFTADVLADDIIAAKRNGQGYLPVIFPGFSWHNLRAAQAPLNQIPRGCGRFYQHQAANVLKYGSDMIYTAMFDEIDEGTAIFKLVTKPNHLPVGEKLLALNDPTCEVDSDFYLRLAGKITIELRSHASKALIETPH